VSESDEPPVPDDALGLAREIANSYRGKTQPVTPSSKRRVRPAKPNRATRDDPSPLADLLGQVVHDQGWDDQLAATRVFTDWATIVGPEVAQHSEVIAFEDGVVEIKAASTAWATELKFLAPRIVAKLNAELGDGSVLRIQVRGPQAPSWKKGPRSIRGARGPRDTYG
jgi:predicted nucleic acid-binding Zn ribbon protein